MSCIQVRAPVCNTDRHRLACLLGVSSFALAVAIAPAAGQQIRVWSGEDRVVDNASAYAHTTADSGNLDADAVWVRSGKLTITSSDVDLKAEGRAASALRIDAYGSAGPGVVTIIGKEGSTARLSATGVYGSVVSMSGKGSSLYLENVEVTGLSQDGRGILTMDGSSLSLVNSTVESYGIGVTMQGDYGVRSASTFIDGSTIRTYHGTGIHASNGTLVAQNFSVTAGWDAVANQPTTFGSAYGVNANNNSNVTLTNGRIETWSNYGNGIFAANNSSDTSEVRLRLNNVDIITHGDNATGIENIQVRSVINGGSIHTYGLGGHGIGSSNGGVAGWAPAHVTLNGTKITTEGISGYGLVATTTSTIDAKGVEIVTKGESAIGARSHNTGRITLSDGTRILTEGAYAHGAAVTFGSHIDISSTEITTRGENAAGLYLVGYNTPENVTPTTKHVNSAKVKDSVIEAKRGPALRVGGGGSSTFDLENTRVTGTGEGALLFSSADYIYDDGTNVIPMPVGKASVNAAASSLEGDILVQSGAVNFDLREGSFLKGAALVGQAGLMLDHLAIDKTSEWMISGASTLNTLESAGTVSFAAPDAGGAFKTLTVKGDYLADDSLFILNSKLGDDSSETDSLIFEGAVSGTSRVSVLNAGGLGALTTGNGIMLIDAQEAASDAFVQQGRISAGAYDYTLFAADKSGSFDGKWYLRSTYVPTPDPDPNPNPNPNPDPDPDPNPNPGPGTETPELPDYRPEVSLDMVAPVLANRFGIAMLGTYHDRRDTLDVNAPSLWFRTFGESGDAGSKANGAEGRLKDFYRDGPTYDYKLGGFQAGLDLYFKEQPNGTRDIAGLFVGIGRAEAEVDRVYGSTAGDTTLNGYGFGGYWTHIDHRGWYTDAVVQGMRYDPVRSNSTDDIAMRTAGWGFISSLEGGYRFTLNDGWMIEPQAQLIYQHVSLDDSSDRFGRIAFGNTDTVYGRVGARVGREWQAQDGRLYSAWARANVWHAMGDDAKTTFANLEGGNRVAFASNIGGTWGQVGLGISGQLTQNVSLFANGDYSHTLGHNGAKGDSLAGRLGLKVKW